MARPTVFNSFSPKQRIHFRDKMLSRSIVDSNGCWLWQGVVELGICRDDELVAQ